MTKHAIRRARERYKINLSSKDIDIIVDAIQRNDPSIVLDSASLSNTRTCFLIRYAGKDFPVVYRKGGHITTILYRWPRKR